LYCKHWKVNGVGKESDEAERYSDHRRRIIAKQEIERSLISPIMSDWGTPEEDVAWKDL